MKKKIVQSARESFDIIGGPKHWFDLALCLGEPYPRPVDGYMAGGMRHPGFELDMDGMWDRLPKARNGRRDWNPEVKAQEKIIYRVSGCGGKIPLRIERLSSPTKRFGSSSARWRFRGMLTSYPSDVSNKEDIDARGWYDFGTGKGKITLSNPHPNR